MSKNNSFCSLITILITVREFVTSDITRRNFIFLTIAEDCHNSKTDFKIFLIVFYRLPPFLFLSTLSSV